MNEHMILKLATPITVDHRTLIEIELVEPTVDQVLKAQRAGKGLDLLVALISEQTRYL